MGGIPIGRIAGLPVSVKWSVLVILWLFTPGVRRRVLCVGVRSPG